MAVSVSIENKFTVMYTQIFCLVIVHDSWYTFVMGECQAWKWFQLGGEGQLLVSPLQRCICKSV